MKKIIVPIIILVVACGGSFYGGVKYTQNKAAAGRQARFQQLDQPGTVAAFSGGMRSNRGGAGFVSGEITSKDEKSLTVKLQDGGSKIVFFSASTQITKSASGSTTDLKVGETVMVNGNGNQDGSVTAQLIQLRPANQTQPAGLNQK